MINRDNTVTAELLNVINCQCQLGECVLWHTAQQAIYWLDIEGAQLHRYFVNTQLSEHFNLPQRIGSFAFTTQDHQIIAAFAQGIARYHLKTGELQWITRPELHLAGNRFNDGRADRQGRFWAGSMVENPALSKQKASLYCVDHQFNCHNKINALNISNGLCWNVAGDILFHTDSLTQTIFQYDFCEKTGVITNKRLFASTHGSSFPDGSTVDAQDYLWNAQWASNKVVRYDSNGKVNFSITLPVSQPSCVAIGGPNLNWLIVTTAKQGLSENELTKEPLAGNLFIYQLTGASALIEPYCTI